jgi:putative membrane protein
MLVSWIFAALHLLALGIGLGAIWWRSRALRDVLNIGDLKRVFFADNLWGLAALLWISTGLVRAFGGLEKGTAYYLASNAFLLKMGLLALVLLIEIWPASTFVRWRIKIARGQDIGLDARLTNRFANFSLIQAALVVAMIFTATAMARGLGF